MYEIRPESVKTFIEDSNIRLPRFQRKQTWNDKKNFQLCISLFKEFPIGVSILSLDTSNKKKTTRWLLDGRQRRNALKLIYLDPENIYTWSKKFIKFKNSDQPSEVSEKFWEAIKNYLEDDIEDGIQDIQESISEDLSLLEKMSVEEEDMDDSEVADEFKESYDESKTGLELLLEIIIIFHNKSKNNSGFTKPFDFTDCVEQSPYVENKDGQKILVSKKVKSFIKEYSTFCVNEDIAVENKDSFIQFVLSRGTVKDKNKLDVKIKKNWENIQERISIVEKIEEILSISRIGIIEVKNLSPTDSQKIFNIINSEGEKLTAVEILSAKPSWNIRINNPSSEMIKYTSGLYERISTEQSDVVRWDLPATFVKRIHNGIIFKQFTDKKSDFETELTLGFKVLAGLFENGIKKDDVEELSKNKQIIWETDIENIIREFTILYKLIGSFSYFKFFKSWKISLMELTSNTIVLSFLTVMYKDWERKDKPIGNDTKVKQLQKNAFILFDKYIYEYVTSQWKGSSDSRVANNIKQLSSEEALFIPITKEKWLTLLDEIYNGFTVDGTPLTTSMMRPILYHFYCMNNLQGPDSLLNIEVDHIIPQSLFDSSGEDKDKVKQNSLYNLGLLPKDENISKSNKKLIEINDEWLKQQIIKYEAISEADFKKYSDIKNWKELYEKRWSEIRNVFTTKRDDILIN